MSNIITRNPDFPATDAITPAGWAAAHKHLRDINPNLSDFEASLIVDVIARDWAHGEEDRVFKTLSHYVDLTGAYRVVAALVAESKTATYLTDDSGDEEEEEVVPIVREILDVENGTAPVPLLSYLEEEYGL